VNHQKHANSDSSQQFLAALDNYISTIEKQMQSFDSPKGMNG